MKCKNLETGNIANQGDKFLSMQPKPYIAANGKYYENGVWVEHKEAAKSDAAAKIIEKAKEPVPTVADKVAPTAPAPKAAPEVVTDKQVV